MIRYLCDTSALIAAVSSWHEHHDRTCVEIERRKRSNEQLVLAAHSLAETYAVLTRLPAPYRLRSADAIALIEQNWKDTPVVHLTGAEMWNALHEAPQDLSVQSESREIVSGSWLLRGPQRQPLFQQPGRDLGLHQMLVLGGGRAHRGGRRSSRRRGQGSGEPGAAGHRLRRAVG